MPKPKKIVDIVVEGVFMFPIDMLRSDCCYPATEKDSGTINQSFQRTSDVGEPYRVTLRLANAALTPNFDRWRTHGWPVVEIR
jgi:hypothetical protein